MKQTRIKIVTPDQPYSIVSWSNHFGFLNLEQHVVGRLKLTVLFPSCFF